MTAYENDRSPLSRLITWLLLAILAIAAVKMAFWLLGVAFGLGAWMLFTVGPLLLAGWLLLKLIRWLGPPRES